MEQKFKTGDLVQLNSGGPIMTVRNYKKHRGLHQDTISNHLVDCSWFNNMDEIQTVTFEQDSLKLIDNEEK